MQPIPNTIGYYEDRPATLAEAEAYIRDDFMPGYQPIWLGVLDSFMALKGKYGKLGADYWAERDVEIMLNYTLYRIVQVRDTRITNPKLKRLLLRYQDRVDSVFNKPTMDSPSFLQLLQLVQSIFDAYNKWYKTPWA